MLELLELVLLAPQLGLDPVELGLDDRLPVAKHGDLAGELVELVVVARELGREHALAVLLLVELGLLCVEARLQVLGRGAAGAEQRRDREQGGARERWPQRVRGKFGCRLCHLLVACGVS